MINWIVSSSVLIVAVLLLRWLLKGRIRLHLQYALWLVVLVRLLIPIHFGEFVFSVANAVTVVQGTAGQEHAENFTVTTTTKQTSITATQAPSSDSQSSVVTVQTDANHFLQKNKTPSSFNITKVLLIVWYVGMGVMAVWLILGNVGFTLRLRRSRRDAEIVFRGRQVYVCEAVETPCLSGLFHPAIYLTQEAFDDKQLLYHTLEHEWTHYHHGDLYWSFLRGVVLVLHWYNPLVWLAAILSRRDAELCCDECTVARMGEQARVQYGETLIRLTSPATVTPKPKHSKLATSGNTPIKPKRFFTGWKLIVSVLSVAAVIGVVTGLILISEKPPVQGGSELIVTASYHNEYQKENGILYTAFNAETGEKPRFYTTEGTKLKELERHEVTLALNQGGETYSISFAWADDGENLAAAPLDVYDDRYAVYTAAGRRDVIQVALQKMEDHHLYLVGLYFYNVNTGNVYNALETFYFPYVDAMDSFYQLTQNGQYLLLYCWRTESYWLSDLSTGHVWPVGNLVEHGDSEIETCAFSDDATLIVECKLRGESSDYISSYYTVDLETFDCRNTVKGVYYNFYDSRVSERVYWYGKQRYALWLKADDTTHLLDLKTGETVLLENGDRLQYIRVEGDTIYGQTTQQKTGFSDGLGVWNKETGKCLKFFQVPEEIEYVNWIDATDDGQVVFYSNPDTFHITKKTEAFLYIYPFPFATRPEDVL